MAEQTRRAGPEAPVAYNADEYEEITSDEVDRVTCGDRRADAVDLERELSGPISRAAADENFLLVYDEMGEGFEPADDVQTEAA